MEIGQILLPFLLLVFLYSLYRHQKLWVAFFTVLRKSLFPLFTVFLVLYVFGISSQGRNIINELDFFKSGFRKYSTLLAIWIWAYNSYKYSDTNLFFISHGGVFSSNHKLYRNIQTNIPILIGILPWLVSTLVLLLVREVPDYRILVFLLSGFFLFVTYLLFRKYEENPDIKHEKRYRLINRMSLNSFGLYSGLMNRLNHWVNQKLGRENVEFSNRKSRKLQLKSHWHEHMNGEQILNWGLTILLFILIAIWPIFFSKYIGPIGLILVSISFYTVVATILVYLNVKTGFPAFPILLVAIAVFTMVSDNNLSGYIQEERQDNRETLEQNFHRWISKRDDGRDTLNITLVAAEGGGLRSAYWTYSVLRKLQLENPEFYHQIFGISSVSGGSLGAALFCSAQGNGISEPMEQTPILNEDNLSPMIAALFFRELVQSLLPFDLESLDRSRVMDQTFETHWKLSHPNNHTWENNFLNLWKNKPDLPALFINSIHVESGSSVLLSNLKIDTNDIQSIDMLGMLDSELSLSTAVGISARFPFVQPPAKIEYRNGKSWGHLADGGYFENSGVAVIYQVYLKLRDEVEKINWKNKKPEIRFSIIYLSNGAKKAGKVANTFLSEINGPLNTLMNSWNSKGFSYAHLAKMGIHRMRDKDGFFEFRLARDRKELPLGWYLSEESRQEIIRQSEALVLQKEYQKFLHFSKMMK